MCCLLLCASVWLGSWLLLPGSWLLTPGSWLLTPGSWLLVYGSWVLVPLLFCLYWKKTQYFSHLPSPGPCLPGVGHLPTLLTGKGVEDPVNHLWHLYQHHSRSGLLWFRLFNLNFVTIGDFETLKQIFSHPDCQDRLFPNYNEYWEEHKNMKHIDKEGAGILFSEGTTWSHMRRFSVKTLKDLGFLKSSMNELIGLEVKHFVSYLKTAGEEPQNICHKFNLPIINSLWTTMVGQRFDYDNPSLNAIVAGLSRLVNIMGSPGELIGLAFPWLARIAPLRQVLGRNDSVKVVQDILSLLRASIEEHEATLDPNDPRDYIDMFLREISRTTETSSVFYGSKGREQLLSSLLDLFGAGSETTSKTLSWSVVYMLRYPEVQEKVQEELDRVVGRDRAPTMEDMPHLPYIEATLMEVQRYCNLGPNGVPHFCRKEIIVNGLTIPANTIIQGLFAEVLKGPYWGDGQVFRPSRFLTSCGAVRRDERLVPFSLGRRRCPGESLARAELFLFFSGLLHEFSLQPSVAGSPPAEDYRPGLTVAPQDYTVRLLQRMETIHSKHDDPTSLMPASACAEEIERDR